jgi:hypothetical protein
LKCFRQKAGDVDVKSNERFPELTDFAKKFFDLHLKLGLASSIQAFINQDASDRAVKRDWSVACGRLQGEFSK